LKQYKYGSSHVLAFGELNIDINHINSFEINGNIDQDSHIILCNSNSDNILKKKMINTCVKSSYEVTIYDHLGTTLNRYLRGRTNNNHGTVSNKLVNMELFSQINLPTVKECEKVYLVIDNYAAFNNVLLDKSKESLISQDFKKFIKKNMNKKFNMKKQMYLYIDAELYNKCKDYIKFNDYFSDVYIGIKPTECLVEYLMGSIISTCDKKFQGQLDINKNVTSVFTNNCNTSVVCRNNGIIQFNTNNGSDKLNFIVIMEESNDSMDVINIKYKDTLIATSEKMNTDYSEINFKTIDEMMDAIIFYNELKSLHYTDVSTVLMNNSKKVLHYLLSSEADYEDFKTDPLKLVLKYKNKFYIKINDIIQNAIVNRNYIDNDNFNPLEVKYAQTMRGLHREFSVSKI